MAATLISAAMKADLATGNARILLIPQIDVLTDTSFTDADEIFTTDGTLAIAEAEPTKTSIKLDQNGGEILTNTYQNGETTIKGTIPSQSSPLYDYIYNKITANPVVSAANLKIKGFSYQVAGVYSLNKKIIPVTMFVESASRKTAIVFMHNDFYAIMDDKTVNTTVSSFGFTATNLHFENGDFTVLKNGIATT